MRETAAANARLEAEAARFWAMAVAALRVNAATPTTATPSSAVPTTVTPSLTPSHAPTLHPTTVPATYKPSFAPSRAPSNEPTAEPTTRPTPTPSHAPSNFPAVDLRDHMTPAAASIAPDTRDPFWMDWGNVVAGTRGEGGDAATGENRNSARTIRWPPVRTLYGPFGGRPRT